MGLKTVGNRPAQGTVEKMPQCYPNLYSGHAGTHTRTGEMTRWNATAEAITEQ